jgi:hypothetical protein
MGVSSQYVASSSSIANGAVSEAKLAAEACSAAKMKKEGTATWVLTSNGAGAVPSYQVNPGATAAWSLISAQTLGGAATGITFDSYAAGFKAFYIDFNMKVAANANAFMIRPNADNGANYSSQWIHSTGSTLSTNTTSNGTYIGGWEVHNLAANDIVQGSCYIQNTTPTTYKGFTFRAVGISGFSDIEEKYGRWQSTSDITSITITNSLGANFSAGSYAILWGLS